MPKNPYQPPKQVNERRLTVGQIALLIVSLAVLAAIPLVQWALAQIAD